MSLMGTLVKVAVGIAVAKSVGGLLKNTGQRSGRIREAPGGPWSGGVQGAGGRGSPQPRRRGGETGLEDMMGDIFAKAPNRADARPEPRPKADTDPFGPQSGPVVAREPGSEHEPEPGQGGGGLGDLLEHLGGQGQIDRAAGRGGGGLGDILGGVLAGTRAGSGRGGSFGDILNDAIRNGGEPDIQPSRAQEAAAALMLRAMIQAAKSDGRIDPAEQQKLMESLGDAKDEEMAFVRSELRQPIDIAGLCAQVPDGLQQQVYAMSLMAIRLDSRTEAEYLHELGSGLGLSRRDINAIHSRLQVAPLYS